ncbi:MAG: hypothetical protein HZC37_09950 [Burkholderiales bacterium]|nr:hypothetical protein [Burkholderiales bacterium]
MSQITLHAPAPVAVPRGAEWAATTFAAFLKLVEGLWISGNARRAHLRRVKEAAALRRVAASVSRHDPGFASDLFAAADRHIDRADGR